MDSAILPAVLFVVGIDVKVLDYAHIFIINTVGIIVVNKLQYDSLIPKLHIDILVKFAIEIPHIV